MKFKNLIGVYQAPAVKNEDGIAMPVVYPQGSVFEAEVDLTRYNRMGYKKFKRMPDDAKLVIASPQSAESQEPKPTEIDDVFSSMTIVELREEAEEHGIDLGNARKKDEILAILRRAATGVESTDIED